MLTKPEIARAVEKLKAAGFSPPRDEAGFVGVCHESFNRTSDAFDSTHLAAAVNAIIDADSAYWPKPAKLRAAMIEVLAAENRARGGSSTSTDWNLTQEGPCPVCGASLRVLEPAEQVYVQWDDEGKTFRHMGAVSLSPRFGILHDRRKHEAARVPAIGYQR